MTVRDLPDLPGVEHRFLDVGGLRTHVALAGSGDPLVLLHATVRYYRNLVTREIPLLLAGQYRWSRLTVPTLVLTGDRDPIVPVDSTREFGTLATDVSVEVLDEVGHFPATEQPELVAARALEFFGAQKSPPSKPPKSP